MTNQEVFDFVLQRKSEKNAQEIAAALTQAAIDKGSQDNVSAIVVLIN